MGRKKPGNRAKEPWMPPVEPYARYIAPGVEVTPERRALAERLAENEAVLHGAYRRLMDWLGVAAHCPRKPCRRAGACRSPKAACFYELRPQLAEHVLPAVMRALAARKSRYAPADGEEAES